MSSTFDIAKACYETLIAVYEQPYNEERLLSLYKVLDRLNSKDDEVLLKHLAFLNYKIMLVDEVSNSVKIYNSKLGELLPIIKNSSGFHSCQDAEQLFKFGFYPSLIDILGSSKLSEIRELMNQQLL